MMTIMASRLRLTFRNYRIMSVSCNNKRYTMLWGQMRWWLVAIKKTCCHQQTYCFNTGFHNVQDLSKTVIKHSDSIVHAPDMMKVEALSFNLAQGGQSIVDILKNNAASVVITFVRTSALAKELVKELVEHHFNAIVVDETSNFDIAKEQQTIFVVGDKMATVASLPPADLLIQVQAPLSGVHVMKERLHMSNFTNCQGKAVLLYNNNDIKFITELGQIVEITRANSMLHHVSAQEEKLMVTSEENLLSLPKDVEKSPAVSRKVKSALFKPVYPHQRIKNARNSFVDRVRLYPIGGTGGNGSPRTGARGGDGGDVILECQSKATLRHFRFKENRRPKAGHGQHCCTQAKRVTGQRGEDLIIPVPIGTVVRDERSGHVIADMDTIGFRVKLVSGGRGGSSITPAGGGEKGERRMVILEYKMYTDVGLVGFPNAGKSTLLRAISNAKPKVAEYAFTSLSPTLGRIQLDDFNQLTVADLPGLIEGAYQNRGLGLKFLRHIERSRILMFVVDMNGFQLSSKHPKRTAFETICLLAKELSLYRKDVLAKPKILVLNKMDCPGAEDKYRMLREKIDHLSTKGIALSPDESTHVTNKEHVIMPKDFRFDFVLAVSALTSSGADDIGSKLNELIGKLNE